MEREENVNIDESELKAEEMGNEQLGKKVENTEQTMYHQTIEPQDNSTSDIHDYQNNEYQNNDYQNNSYQANHTNNNYQSNGYTGNNYQNNGYQNNTNQNDGNQNSINQNNGYQNTNYQNNNHQNNDYQSNNYQSNNYQYNGYQNNGYQGNYNQNQGYQNNYQTSNPNMRGYQSYGPYQTGYQNVPPVKETKPEKKRKAAKIIGFVAAAIAVGLIIGGAFEVVMNLRDRNTSSDFEISDNGSNNIKEDNASDKTILNVSLDTTEKVIVGDVSETVENVLPSIVAITSRITTTGYDWFGREFAEEGVGSGSGIIIAQDDDALLIITNNHVIEDAQIVEVVFCDDTKAKATVKGSEASADLAVLSIPMKDLSDDTISSIRIATLGDSTELKVGQPAIAIGNALGYGQSVTVGYISALEREVQLSKRTMKLLQTDAAINPGNSGGALINAYGEVIGINSVKYASTNVESIGYAIPISDAIPIINDLMNRETLTTEEQGYLGIDLDAARDVSDMYSQVFGMPVGVYVGKVIDGSPADKAGLKDSSVITAIDDKEILTIEQLQSVLSYKRAGETIRLTVQIRHNGGYNQKELEVTLGNRPKN